MAVLAIRIMGDPVLHAPAALVAEIDDDVRQLVQDMYETMDAAPGVGLAAPQVGVGLRIFTYSYTDEDGAPWRGVIINPELWIAPLEPGEPDPDEESEGCLSFPGERFPLRRSERALLRAVGLDREAFEVHADGWLARIFQHEFDHLNGILYADRLDHPHAKAAAKVIKKRSWGSPGQFWLPGEDDLEG